MNLYNMVYYILYIAYIYNCIIEYIQGLYFTVKKSSEKKTVYKRPKSHVSVVEIPWRIYAAFWLNYQ